jgi:hypothetical protein
MTRQQAFEILLNIPEPILTAINSTRLRPSSTQARLSHSLFVRYTDLASDHRCEITGDRPPPDYSRKDPNFSMACGAISERLIEL